MMSTLGDVYMPHQGFLEAEDLPALGGIFSSCLRLACCALITIAT